MKLIKNFAIVVVSLVGDLWLELGVKPQVYDKRGSVKLKLGIICDDGCINCNHSSFLGIFSNILKLH